MARLKRIFIGFAIEDEWARNLLRGQARLGDSPIEYTDYSVKEPWSEEWKTKCRQRIRSCDGFIGFLSSNTRTADGARWEIKTAVEEGVPVLGVWTTESETYIPPEMPANKVIRWTWPGIANFIKSIP